MCEIVTAQVDFSTSNRPISSIYVHVPFCRQRCGYCDFNTYTNLEIGGSANASNYAQEVCRDMRQMAKKWETSGQKVDKIRTVFFGGGTPTSLPVTDIVQILREIQSLWGLDSQAEVTTEANPDTLDEPYLDALEEGGFTRVSVGMQSANKRILQILERTHDTAHLKSVAALMSKKSLQFSVDLIYGTPGESTQQWQESIDTALKLQPDHISAYALGIEPNTRLGRQVRTGQLPPVDDDVAAEYYQQAETVLTAAGYQWYEISNWAKSGYECQHNLAYWRDDNWWGFGPGAHSHVDGWRAWNHRHPRAWSQAVDAGQVAVAGSECLSPAQRHLESLMLALRLRTGLAVKDLVVAGVLAPEADAITGRLVEENLLESWAWEADRAVPTLTGRLILDTITLKFADLLIC